MVIGGAFPDSKNHFAEQSDCQKIESDAKYKDKDYHYTSKGAARKKAG